MLSVPELGSAAVVLVLGAILQTAVGFGIGLFAIPLLIWLGHSLPHSVALLLGAAAVQSAIGVVAMRRIIDWRRTIFIGAFQWAAVPLGILAMGWFIDLGMAAVKQAVGASLFVLVTLRLFFRPAPRERLARPWGALSGGAAGFLAGMVGMGGPPLVFYAQAHAWDKDRFRGFLWAQLLTGQPAVLAMLTWRSGPTILVHYALGLALAPLLWLGTRAGFSLTARWKLHHVSLSATVVLYAIAVASMTAPFVGQ